MQVWGHAEDQGQVLDSVWCCSVILTSCSPESTSRRRISMRPSRRSVYKSPIRQVTRPKWEFTHLVKVFFCTASRSSAMDTTVEGHVYKNSGFTTFRQIYIFLTKILSIFLITVRAGLQYTLISTEQLTSQINYVIRSPHWQFRETSSISISLSLSLPLSLHTKVCCAQVMSDPAK